MGYKLLLSLILTLICGDIIGQTTTGTIINLVPQPTDSLALIIYDSDSIDFYSTIIDGDSEIRGKTFNVPIRLPSVIGKKLPPNINLTLPSYMELENSFLNENFRSRPHLNLANVLNLEPYNNYNKVTPFGYHYNSRFEGVNAVGLNIRLVSTSVVDFVITPLLSITYMGHYHPARINNLSLQANLAINIGDAVKLKFSGRYSANQGINPMLLPMFGASNYFGAAVQVRITDGFGLEAGFRREYFMGKWTTIYYISPVFY